MVHCRAAPPAISAVDDAALCDGLAREHALADGPATGGPEEVFRERDDLVVDGVGLDEDEGGVHRGEHVRQAARLRGAAAHRTSGRASDGTWRPESAETQRYWRAPGTKCRERSSEGGGENRAAARTRGSKRLCFAFRPWRKKEKRG